MFEILDTADIWNLGYSWYFEIWDTAAFFPNAIQMLLLILLIDQLLLLLQTYLIVLQFPHPLNVCYNWFQIWYYRLSWIFYNCCSEFFWNFTDSCSEVFLLLIFLIWSNFTYILSNCMSAYVVHFISLHWFTSPTVTSSLESTSRSSSSLSEPPGFAYLLSSS